MNTFSALRTLAGLSLEEAARLLGARTTTVHAWEGGTLPCPTDAIDELRGVITVQSEGAARILEMIDRLAVDTSVGLTVELEMTGLKTDDEARSLGYPCASAYMPTLARIIAGAPKGVTIRLV